MVKHNPSRAKLAEKIVEVRALERELEAARSAVLKAEERKFSAIAALERLQVSNKEVDASRDVGATFIAALARGQDCGVDVLDRPQTSQREDELQREVEIWRATEKSCAAIVPDLEERLRWANRHVEAAVKDVVRNAGVVAPLLDGLAELEAEVMSRRLALNYLAAKGLISEADVDAVKRALRDTVFPGYATATYFSEWLVHPVTQAWGEALGALKRNADASLPENTK